MQQVFFTVFDAKECAFPLYVFKLLGVETVIITNSSGAINPNYKPGDIMMIKSHINFTGLNPLIPSPVISYGEERFVDISECYSKECRNKIKQVAKSNKFKVYEGVFLQDLGPSYETPAEINMARVLGADAVGIGRNLMEPLKEGAAGVAKRIDVINHELMTVMARTGAENISEIDPAVIRFRKF